jgi:DNA-binding response OmpR family regulator
MVEARSILVVENDHLQGRKIAECLTTDNEFAVTIAVSLSQADVLLNAFNSSFDTVLLDLDVPDGDGHSFCARMRTQGHKMPVIFLAGSYHEEDVVLGMAVGGCDYVVKPLRANELRARVRAQLRAFDNSEDAVFMVGHYMVRPAARVALDTIKNRRLQLTTKETALLKFLYKSGPGSVAKSVLLAKIWGYHTDAATRTLQTHVYSLRQKLEADPADCRFLITVPGGYQLNPLYIASGAVELAGRELPA